MRHPRFIITPEAAAQRRLSAKKLREARNTLRLSRIAFSQMIGMSPDLLASREAGRTPWREQEVFRVESILTVHVKTAAEQLQCVFEQLRTAREGQPTDSSPSEPTA